MLPYLGFSIGSMSAVLAIICLWSGALGAFWGSRRTLIEFALVLTAWVALFWGNGLVSILGLGYIFLLTNASAIIVSAVVNYFYPDSGWKTIALSFMGAAFVIAFVGVFTVYDSSISFFALCLFLGFLALMINPLSQFIDGANFVIGLLGTIGLLSLYTKDLFFPPVSGSWHDATRLVVDNYISHVHWLAQVLLG